MASAATVGNAKNVGKPSTRFHSFNQISAYHVHLKVHSNVREFVFEDCGMTFKLKHSLKKHQLVHKGEFGHTCDFCGKKFKRSDNLINHMR